MHILCLSQTSIGPNFSYNGTYLEFLDAGGRVHVVLLVNCQGHHVARVVGRGYQVVLKRKLLVSHYLLRNPYYRNGFRKKRVPAIYCIVLYT